MNVKHPEILNVFGIFVIKCKISCSTFSIKNVKKLLEIFETPFFIAFIFSGGKIIIYR